MQQSIPLILFGISTLATPGPNNFMLLNAGLNYGIKQSLPHYFGICLGFPLMVLILALGFGSIFQHYLWIKTGLKILGAAYMLYLAGQLLWSARSSVKEEIPKNRPFRFYQAVLFQWVNPKAWLIAVSALAMFTLNEEQIINGIILSVAFFILGLPCTGIWLIFGNYLRQVLKNPLQKRCFSLIMAIFLIVSILLILID